MTNESEYVCICLLVIWIFLFMKIYSSQLSIFLSCVSFNFFIYSEPFVVCMFWKCLFSLSVTFSTAYKNSENY